MMNQTLNLASGCMPNTDFRYEEFEALLACYYLTYEYLANAKNENAVVAHEAFMDVLNRIAKRHNVQSPEDAAKNFRATEEWARPHKFKSPSNSEDHVSSFWRDFAVVQSSKEDCKDVFILDSIIKHPTFRF